MLAEIFYVMGQRFLSFFKNAPFIRIATVSMGHNVVYKHKNNQITITLDGIVDLRLWGRTEYEPYQGIKTHLMSKCDFT